MKNRKPNITVICEGQTEELFLKHLKNMYETKYNLTIDNAHCSGEIKHEYKKNKKINPSAEVNVMYDLDENKKLPDIIELYKSDDLELKENDELFFINPEFELVFELCKGNKKDRDHKKFIKKYYNVENYDKSDGKIKEVLRKIKKEEIEKMQKNLKENNHDPNLMYSSNYDILFDKIYNLK